MFALKLSLLLIQGIALLAFGAFIHPGVLHNATALAQIKAKASSTNPRWQAAYSIFSSDSYTSSDYAIQGPLAVINATQADPVNVWGLDAKAAYQNALEWTITGDAAHANKAISILNAWASTAKAVIGDNDVLRVGIYGFLMANAAEIIRYTNAGWAASDIATFSSWLTDTLTPVILDTSTLHSFNWGQAQSKTLMSFGIFTDNQSLYDTGLGYILPKANVTTDLCEGVCCVGILQTIDPEHGQDGESGRDQQHAQLELSSMAEACEVARTQGDGGACYQTGANLLAKGFEFTSVVLRNGTVEWNPDAFSACKDIWWSRSALDPDGLWPIRPIYEMAYAYYHDILGLSIDNVATIRSIAGVEGQMSNIYDCPGFGTLLFAYT